MAKKRYLVVHPKLVMGEPLKAGQEIQLEEAHAKSLVSSGKLQLVVGKEPESKPKRKLTNGSKSKRQASKRDKTE